MPIESVVPYGASVQGGWGGDIAEVFGKFARRTGLTLACLDSPSNAAHGAIQAKISGFQAACGSRRARLCPMLLQHGIARALDGADHRHRQSGRRPFESRVGPAQRTVGYRFFSANAAHACGDARPATGPDAGSPFGTRSDAGFAPNQRAVARRACISPTAARGANLSATCPGFGGRGLRASATAGERSSAGFEASGNLAANRSVQLFAGGQARFGARSRAAQVPQLGAGAGVRDDAVPADAELQHLREVVSALRVERLGTALGGCARPRNLVRGQALQRLRAA